MKNLSIVIYETCPLFELSNDSNYIEFTNYKDLVEKIDNILDIFYNYINTNVELYIDHRLLTRCEYLIILTGANMNISINSDRFKNHFMDMCKYREEQIKKIL